MLKPAIERCGVMSLGLASGCKIDAAGTIAASTTLGSSSDQAETTLRISENRLSRRSALTGFATTLVLAPRSSTRAQTNRKTVRLVVPFAPGGTIDLTARILTPSLSEELGQTWIVDNRSGGNGTVGTAEVARSVPDGNTLLLAPELHLLMPVIMKYVPYNPVVDFTPVARVALSEYVLVGSPSSLQSENLNELVKLLRERPNLMTMAVSARGGTGHLAAAGLGRRLGIEPLIVTYRGTGPAISEVINGSVPLTIVDIAPVLSLIREGRLRAYAIMSAHRSMIAPEIPSVDEAGLPGLYFEGWRGIWGPRGLPAELVNELNAAIQQTLKRPDVLRKFANSGIQPILETATDFSREIVEEVKRTTELATSVGITPE